MNLLRHDSEESRYREQRTMNQGKQGDLYNTSTPPENLRNCGILYIYCITRGENFSCKKKGKKNLTVVKKRNSKYQVKLKFSPDVEIIQVPYKFRFLFFLKAVILFSPLFPYRNASNAEPSLRFLQCSRYHKGKVFLQFNPYLALLMFSYYPPVN